MNLSNISSPVNASQILAPAPLVEITGKILANCGCSKVNLLSIEKYGAEILDKYPDCKELLEQYSDAIHITAACEGLQDFEWGFRLGAAFMLDIFKD